MDDSSFLSLDDNNKSKRGPGSGSAGFLRSLWNGLTLPQMIILAVLVGGSFGTLMQDASEDWHKVIIYPGVLFVRLLKLCVVPLIALNMIVGVNNLGESGGSSFGAKAIGFYFFTTIMAVAGGVVWVNIVNPGRRGVDELTDDDCDLTTAETLEIVCVSQNWTTYDTEIDCSCLNEEEDVTILDTVLGIGYQMCPTNIISTLMTGNILGIICAFIAFGAALSHEDNKSQVLNFCDTCLSALMRIICNIVRFTPLGIGSLVAGEIARNEDFWDSVQDLGLVVLTICLGFLTHIMFYASCYMIVVKKNPLPYLWNMSEAFMTALATSSSAATMPVTFRCVEEKNKIRKETTQFMIPLGATINMDGSAIYFPIAVIWIAQMTDHDLSMAEQIITGLTSALVSVGAAPIPSAGLVYLVLIADTAGLDTEDARVEGLIALLWAIDWFLDRLQTAVNILGDSVGAGCVDKIMSGGEKGRLSQGMRKSIVKYQNVDLNQLGIDDAML